MIRYSTATWNGPGMTGNGKITSESKSLANLAFNFESRFEKNEAGTNPEELLAAAHATCFVMKLSFVVGEAGYEAQLLQTTAHISFVNGAIVSSHLVIKAQILGMSEMLFAENVLEANRCCPISRVLNIAITFETILES